MKMTVVTVIGALVLSGLTASNAPAQKGQGDPVGVARQAVRPAVVTLTGKLLEIKTGPCESTTGWSPIGTHIVLETPRGGPLNVHLGPVTAVADLAGKLKVGQEVQVNAFRTDKMKENHYVAQSVTFGKESVTLRDQNLRPTWAGSNRVFDDQWGGQRWGCGWGQRGRGPGFGPGRGMGWGPGRGAGRGPGFGRCPWWEIP
jgi:hypothetical protein